MIHQKHTSASSIESFSQCPARWLASYDKDLQTYNRNDRADTGKLIHAALEKWRDPDADHEMTYESLEAIFNEVAKSSVYAEKFTDFKRAKELLASAYAMSQSHPVVPIHMMIPISVEQALLEPDGSLYTTDGWPIPVKGSIDAVGIIPVPGKDPNEVILFITDYKTGRQMTHSEITKDGIQASLYMLYARERLVPFLESQVCDENEKNYVVTRIVGSWDFIEDEVGVPIYETDFDHDATRDYVRSIAEQQLELGRRYNSGLPSLGNEKLLQQKRNKFMVPYEKPNSYCIYCPRKNQCTTYEGLRSFDNTVDPTDPKFSWDEIWAQYERAQASAKIANEYLEQVKEITKVYLTQEKLDSIKLADGREIVADQQTNMVYDSQRLGEILGAEFIIENAKIAKDRVEKYVAGIIKSDPARGREMKDRLLTRSYFTTWLTTRQS